MNRFHEEFVELFHAHFHRIQRYLGRLSGEPEMAADIAQEAFVRLYRRGALPDAPEAWLITVAMNLFRNSRSTRARRERLLAVAAREEEWLADPPPLFPQAEVSESKERVRTALDRMPERDRQILLLRAEGYSYHAIAHSLGLNEASVGTLLARAKRAFRDLYEEATDAP
jgi:RNA polymerase sigma-70 factor (ECF subfamily)